MNGDRVLLLELKERTSAAGNRYLSGWPGKASVVAFLDREAAEPTWQVFVSTPAPRSTEAGEPQARRSSEPRRGRMPGPRRQPSTMQPGELDDDVSDLGTNERASSTC